MHLINFILSPSALPQLAQHSMPSGTSFPPSCFITNDSCAVVFCCLLLAASSTALPLTSYPLDLRRRRRTKTHRVCILMIQSDSHFAYPAYSSTPLACFWTTYINASTLHGNTRHACTTSGETAGKKSSEN